MKKIYDFQVLDGSGNQQSLEKYKGKVLLIINSATECGFTPQYDGLQDMYEKYKEEGLEILDFPCNQFGNQAPGNNEEIFSFCSSRFGITFPIFSKVNVNGEGAEPLFEYLKSMQEFKGFDQDHPLTTLLESMLGRTNHNFMKEPDIKWNFTKFLIDRNGEVVSRFEPTTDLGFVEDKIKELL